MNRISRRIGLLTVTAAAIAAVAGAALGVTRGAAAAPRGKLAGGDGLIAFTRYRFQNSPLWSEIWVAHPDGSGALKVSHSGKAVEDDGAQFSPDGRWIVFTRCPKGPCEVWRVHPDGSGQSQLRVSCPAGSCNDSGVSVAPDGRHMLLVQDWGPLKQGTIPDNDQTEHSAIVETALDGSHRHVIRQLDNWRGGFEAPRLGPDGNTLIWRGYSWHPGRITPDAVYLWGLSGGPAAPITPAKLWASGGEFSPDGKHVLFRSTTPRGGELAPGNAIYVRDLDPPRLHRLTTPNSVTYFLTGAYSPDGGSIVYATGTTGGLADIFTLDLTTGERVQMTHTRNLDGWPTWGRAS
jgi:Tol biopolymer transport system component